MGLVITRALGSSPQANYPCSPAGGSRHQLKVDNGNCEAIKHFKRDERERERVTPWISESYTFPATQS